MQIDLFTLSVLNIILSFLMSACLFTVSRSHFSDIKGIQHWSVALLLLGISWILIILKGVISNSFLIVINSMFASIGVAYYFYALVAFKALSVPKKWVYFVLAFCFIGNVYFIYFHFNMNAKIVVTSLTLAILLFASSAVLLTQQHGICPFSQRLTRNIFACIATLALIRAFYYGFWHPQPEQILLHTNGIQRIFYLFTTITIVGTSFGFVLMCMEKYLDEKNRAQLAEHQAFERLQKIASRVQGVVYQFKMAANGQFSVPYCSEGVADTFRLTPEQVYQDVHTVFNRVHPDDFESFMASIQHSMQTLEMWFCEFRIQLDDGTVRWLGGNANPQRDTDGSTLWHGFVSDITELKEDKQQLQVLSVAIEQSPASVIITDAETCLLYVNPKFTEVTGYSKQEVLGENPRFLQSRLTPPAVYEQMWHTLRQGEIWHGELQNQRKNGELYWDETHISPVKNSLGEITHYVGIKLDITERKQTEIELQQAKNAAELANQAKSEFLANMSHEIRTPMNAILGFSDILTNLITDETHRYYLDAIQRSGKTLLQLINDILDLSKIEAGKFTLQYAPVSVKTIVNDIQLIFSQKAADKSIELSVLMDESLPQMLMLDEIRLQQILLNLVGNAIKFTEQGFIRISVSCQSDLSSVKNQEGRVNLIIAIEDSGIGIPQAQQDKIFAAFTQQDNQNVGLGGTGLGLTISKRLTELMSGHLSVQSKVGKGSCFTIQLNQVEILTDGLKEKSADLISLPKIIHFQSAKLLLVDDIELDRRLIKTYLQDYPEIEIIEAEHGLQSLTLIAEQQFDLIFMDKQLPYMDGDMVCELIRAERNYATVPIIMISASVLQAEENKPVFYDLQLNKPVNKSELLKAMQSFLPHSEIEQTTSEITAIEVTQPMTETINPELLTILLADYQEKIKKFSLAGVMEVDRMIELAEELLKLAHQYDCTVLINWATTLKTQAELFDIANLSKTLQGFDMMLDN